MIEYSRQGAVAWARFARPEKLNAMPRSFWGELDEVLRRAGDDDAVRVLVFCGDGKAFSVGGDLDGFTELADVADRRRYMDEALGAYRRLEEFAKPTIAAVHGHALGGGCELTMVCDIVIADETARFGTPESRVGLVPGLGVVRAHAQLNLHWAKYLVLTGELIDAHEARLAGLVNTVVPAGEHLAAATELAEKIAARAPLALAVGKRLLNRHGGEGWAHAIEAIALLQGTEDLAEGLAAFQDRREPAFEGR
jgi:enoyl-CoA hydratase/carnithine racemase